MSLTGRRWRARLILGVAAAAVVASGAHAQSRATVRIPAQPMAPALRELSRQTGVNILFEPSTTEGLVAPAVRGALTADQAVHRLVDASGLVVVRDSTGSLIIQPATASRTPPPARIEPREPPPPPRPRPEFRPPPLLPPAGLESVIVPASRIQSGGFTAPTPTTVLGGAEISRRAANSVQETLLDLPSIRPSMTPQSTSGQSTGANVSAGGSLVDLHGLGTARTLTLVNGHRTGASSDLRQFPTSLIQRIDVVTGGASAAYGSDGIAGAINIVLDSRLDGFKGNLQYGVTRYGDDRSVSGSLAWGGALTEKLHLLVGGEYFQTTGAHTIYGDIRQDKRPWFAANRGVQISNPCPYNAAVSANCPTGGNGLPNFVDTNDQNFATMNPGGIIVSGPLKGITFEDGGVPRQFQYGLVLGNNQIGGEGTYPGTWWIRPRERHYSLLGRLEFKPNDRTSLWVEYANASNHDSLNFARARDQGSLVIRKDNAFLPASIRSQMTALGLATLQMGRLNNDRLGFSHIYNQTYRYSGGADGALGGGWKWDVYAQFGLNHNFNLTDTSRNTAKWLYALDSVVNAQGVPVCRATLQGDPLAAGCVPFNIFGPNAASDAARAYIFGVQTSNIDTKQSNAQLNVHGEPFSTWAGPVAVAAGLEYRKESSVTWADPIAQVGGWDSGNARATAGRFNVKEGYAEIAVPLAKRTRFARSLDLNGAIRYASYSSVQQGVTTWKIGGTWQPIEEVLVRSTYSKDVRAPSLGQLYAPPQTVRNNVVQFSGPRAGQSTLVDFVNASNPNLRPERGKTWTVGASVSPKFTRLRFSADYYDIHLIDQIAPVGVQAIVDLCRDGRADACGLISFDREGSIVEVLNSNANNASFRVRGLDLEATYTLPLEKLPLGLGLRGTLTGRALATRTYEFASITTAGREDKVGQNATGVIANEPPNMPTWLANYALDYRLGPFSAGISLRYISPGVLQSTSVTGTATSRLNNKLGSQTTTNFQATWRLVDREGRRLQLYGVINNAFNRGPPFPIFAATQWPNFYDTLGTVIRGGIRFQY